VDNSLSVAQNKEGNGQNIIFRKNLNDWDMDRVTDFFVLLSSVPDLNSENLILEGQQRDGSNSVKLCYCMPVKEASQETYGSWNKVWNSKGTSGSNVLYMTRSEKLYQTQDNLQKRGIQLVSKCFLCGGESESNKHLFA